MEEKLNPFETNRLFVKQFKVLLSHLPQPIFHSEAMRDKLLDSLSNLSENIEKARPVPTSGLSFLNKPRKQKKNSA